MKDERPVVPALIGPTASGKSRAALQAAQALGLEILCMDSMQVYRGLDIGTAKPTPRERALVPHHLLDLAEPTESFTVAAYAGLARRAIADVFSRGRTPILVGGTGLYLSAVRCRMSLGGTPADGERRARLRALAEEEGGPARLHALLEARDPAAAARLHPSDVRRVIRALEVAEGGAPQPSREEERAYRVAVFGLTLPRPLLYERIDKRVDEMIKLGLFREFDGLVRRFPFETWQGAAQAIGYKETAGLRAGLYDEAEAVRLIRRNSRRYAKRQMTWFLREADVRWFDAASYPSAEALDGALLEALRRELRAA